MPIDIDQLRTAWQQHSPAGTDLDMAERMARAAATGRLRSSSQKLSQYYRRSNIAAFALPVLAPLLVTVLDLPVWVAAIYAFFGVVMAAMNLLLARFIDDTDICSLPVVTALAAVVAIRKRVVRHKIFGICAGMSVIASMFATAIDNSPQSVIFSFTIGLMIGIVIGVRRIRKVFALISQMESELHSVLEGNS